MKTVIHFKRYGYLPLTENWIHEQVTRLRRYRPIVYTDRILNPETFVVKEVRAIRDELGPSGLFLNRVWQKLLGYSPFYLRSLRGDRPDLVHAHFGHSGVALLRLKRWQRFPLITTFYGFDLTSLPQRHPRWRASYRRLFGAGELFLVEGNQMKRSLMDLGCPEQKIVVQHIGVDVNSIDFQPRILDETQPVRLLVAASLQEKKGIPYALQALAKVREAHPKLPLELTIIGDSTGSAASESEKRRILGVIESLDLYPVVDLLGYQPHATMFEVASQHHIFLAPSVHASDGDAEGGAPVGIIEMSASGMPILATKHCDIPEVVVDGRTGFLVPEKDIDGLAERLEYLVLNPDIWGPMGEYGRRHVEVEYNISTQVEKLEEIYDSVLQAAGRPPA